MEELVFEQLDPRNANQCNLFHELMTEYDAELGGFDRIPGVSDPKAFEEKWIRSIIDMQGPSDRHLELCFAGESPVGFLYGKLDHPEHRGYIRPGWGYVMEFYVRPSFRRRGCGTQMYARLERLLRADGAQSLYLTTDTEAGTLFWQAMGFANSPQKSPENDMEIFEKQVSP